MSLREVCGYSLEALDLPENDPLSGGELWHRGMAALQSQLSARSTRIAETERRNKRKDDQGSTRLDDRSEARQRELEPVKSVYPTVAKKTDLSRL